MIKADTPNLWEIRQNLGVVKTKALIVYALACIAELVNIERNLSEPQMMELAEDILTDYGYFKLEEIKYILKRAVKSEKLFARLDYNIVMGWFKIYNDERTEHCMDISDQELTQIENEAIENANAVSWNEYIEDLQDRATQGDQDAIFKLEQYMAVSNGRNPIEKAVDDYKRELDFKQWFYNDYLKNKR